LSTIPPGGLDDLFPADGVAAAYAKMRAVWKSQDAGERLTAKVWPGHGHVFTADMQDKAYAWPDTWVGGPGG
jgi:glyoxylase-like metal-dependent hydrolase (beta-lactamase superfamily II)